MSAGFVGGTEKPLSAAPISEPRESVGGGSGRERNKHLIVSSASDYG